VLGAILLDGRHLSSMILDVGLTEDDFYREAHGQVFAAMRALQQANEPIDYLTVTDQLERQGQLEAGGERVR
jgi:replicative DNA helicase